jgi:hypothetical protein
MEQGIEQVKFWTNVPSKFHETHQAYRLLEPENPTKAIKLYKEALSVYESEDKLRFSFDTFRRAFSLAIKSQQYVKAIDSYLDIL